MTKKQYDEYSNMLIQTIARSAEPLDDENYANLMNAINELIELVGDHWRERYHDDMI